MCETNAHAHDVNRLASAFGKEAFMPVCDNFAYDRSGTRVPRHDLGKKNGYGTVLISKDTGLLEKLDVIGNGNREFEILPALFRRQNRLGLIITVYRSPSMKQLDEI